jgi:GNAT superfamily N-acetyltransferase
MELNFSTAVESDAPALTVLHFAVAGDLTSRYGQGPWSSSGKPRSALFDTKFSRTLIARSGSSIVGTLHLQTKKPWVIDVAYFTPVEKAIYLTSMAVAPHAQRQGIGRSLIAEAAKQARAWPSNSLRLDAFDADAGAGGFYTKCGFTDRGHINYKGVPHIYFEMLFQPQQ